MLIDAMTLPPPLLAYIHTYIHTMDINVSSLKYDRA